MSDTVAEETAEQAVVAKADKRRGRRVSVRRNVIGIVLALGVLLFGYVGWSAYHQNQQGQVIVALTKANLNSQNNHHAQTNKSNKKQTALLRQNVAQGKTIIAQNQEMIAQNKLLAADSLAILQAHAETAAAIAQVEKFTEEVPQIGAALQGGQQALITCIQSQGANCPSS